MNEDNKFYGNKAYGIPIGDENFIQTWLDKKSLKIRSNIEEISNTLDPSEMLSQDIPSTQCLWLITQTCLQFKGNYFIRHIPPQFTKSFCTTLDNTMK